MNSFFEKFVSLTIQEIAAVTGMVFGAVSVSFAAGSAWARRSQSKKERLPSATMFIGGNQGLHLLEWRHAVLDIRNRLDTDIRLISVHRKRPRKLRLWRFANHQAPPLGAPSINVDLDILYKPRAPTGFEFLFKVPGTPIADSGVEIVIELWFRDLDQETTMVKKISARI